MMKAYRQGAIGALLDIYEQAINELKTVVKDMPDALLTVIVDTQTLDENCRSFQSILSHVVHSGYGYATSIRSLKENNIKRPDKILHTTVKAYITDLGNVFIYTKN